MYVQATCGPQQDHVAMATDYCPLVAMDAQMCDNMGDDNMAAPQPRMLQSCMKWEDFFGSSVELAPSLMTIYDNYASSNGSTKAEVECNHNSLSGTPDQLANQHAPADALSNGSATATSSPNPIVYSKDKVENMAALASGTRLPEVSNNSYCVLDGQCKNAVDSGESDGPPSALGYNHHLQGDPSKKRPLSVSSTSSTTSSTSSLPRPQRKKVAGGVNTYASYNPNGSPLVGNGGFVTGNGIYMIPDPVTGNGAMTAATLAANVTMVTSSRVAAAAQSGILVQLAGAVEITDYAMEEEEEDCDETPSPSTTTPSLTSSRGEATRQNSAGSSGSMTYIDKVVGEILETERAYVHDLNKIIQGYLCELRNDPECPLSGTDVNALFGNIEEIYSFNKVFLGELESCQEDAVRLAQCFVDKNEGFVIYSDYCTNYPGAVEVLTTMMGSSEKAQVLRMQQARLGHTLPLGAYLLKPVQRILKYHLLLQNMLTHMDEGGMEVVSAALASMTNMAAHINEMKRKHEHAVRAQEMQSVLYDWAGADLAAYGELVLEEAFRMHGAKGDRHLLLFEKGLLIAKHKDDVGLQVKDCIKCSNLMLVESIPREPLSFHVIPFDNPRGQYTFQARCQDQKRQWCLELKRLILESYTADKAIPSSVKDKVLTLTSRAGSRDTAHVAHHTPGTPKSCPAPDYLDRKRRPRRRSVTSVLPDFALLKSQVTKKVLPKKGDCTSPKMSPRLYRRRQSESAILRGNIGQLFDKHKKHELLHQVEDLSDTDSAEPAHTRSMESLDSSIASVNTASPAQKSRRSLPHFTVDDAVDGSGCLTWDAASAGDGAGGQLPQDDDNQGSASPSPLKRRESFRIATMLYRVDSRKPPGGKKTSKRGGQHRNTTSPDIPSTPLTTKASNGKPPVGKTPRSLIHSWRRVSEGDLEFLTKDDGVGGEKKFTQGYVTMNTPAVRLNAENDGDDEAEDEVPYSTASKSQAAVQLVEDDEGDFVELAINHGYAANDAKNTTDIPSSPLITNGVNSMENIKNCEPLAQYRNPTRKASLVEGASAFERLPRSQSCATCPPTTAVDKNQLLSGSQCLYDQSTSSSPHPARSKPRPQSPHPNKRCILNQTRLFKNSQWEQLYHNSVLQQSTPLVLPSAANYVNNGAVKQITTRQRNSLKPHIACSGTERKHSMRLRSNSLNSLTHNGDGACAKYSQGKLPSNTLVFIDRSAFVSCSSQNIVRHDVETERAIARLATPPREIGPSDLVQQIRMCKERDMVVNRYATPPRTFTDSSNQSCVEVAASTSEECVAESSTPPIMRSQNNLRPRCHSTLPDEMRYTGQTMLNDFQHYLTQSQSSTLHHSQSVPAAFSNNPNYSGKRQFYRQRSVIETNIHGTPTKDYRRENPSLASPSSESIVELLKQAVFSFTSRIASHLPRSTEVTPRRTTRSRSISALEELRVDTLQEHQKPIRRKDKRGRFVAQLAKVYTDHVKKRGRSPSIERSQSLNLKEVDSTKQLTNLLREGNPGSSVIGERMASAKPLVLGTYTLPRHRPPRPKKGSTNSKVRESTPQPEAPILVVAVGEESPETVVRRREQKVESCNSSAYDSGCLDVGVKDLTLEADDSQGHASLHATLEAFNLVYAGMDVSEDDDAYYYERKFVEDLESNLDDDAFRDSAVYSDEGCTAVDPESVSTNVSIRDTMKLIEQRSKTRSVPRTEIRQEEKAKGIKDILRSLEMATQARIRSNNFDRPLDIEAAASEKAMLKSIRDRTRELVECATLTRIRQTACSVSEDMLSGDEEDAMVDATGAGGTPPLRRGWVKQVVALLQDHPDQLLSSSED